jgi:anaphase-promoting complex subunit 2
MPVSQALRVVDPSDVLLEAVARPIRAYLRARKDTVRCIVTSLTDENSGTYHNSLSQPTSLWI